MHEFLKKQIFIPISLKGLRNCSDGACDREGHSATFQGVGLTAANAVKEMRVQTLAKAFSLNPPGDGVQSKGAGFPYTAGLAGTRLELFPAAFPAPTPILSPSDGCSTLSKPRCLEVGFQDSSDPAKPGGITMGTVRQRRASCWLRPAAQDAVMRSILYLGLTL